MAAKLGKEIYKGTVWSVIDNFVKQAFTFIIFIVLARLLSASLIGLLTFAMLFVQVFRSVIFDSIATAIVSRAQPEEDYYNTGFILCVITAIPAFLLLFLSADLLEQWTNTPGLASVIEGTSFILLTSGLSRMHEAWLQHQMQFKSLAIRSSLSTFFGGIIGILMAVKGFGVYSLVGQQVSTAIIELALIWIVSPWKPKISFSVLVYRDIFTYGKHVAMTGITNFANQNSDAFFVTYYLGSAATGIYATGKRVINTLNTVISASLLRVSLPAFARLKDDEAELRSIYLQTTGFTAILTAPLFAGLSVLSKEIVLLMLGPEWIESAYVMQIVTVIGFLFSIGYFNQSIMLAKNKPEWQTRLTILYAATNIIAFIIFTRYGVVYTALAFTARAVLLYPVSLWCALKLTDCRWRTYIAELWRPVLAAAIMASLIYVVKENFHFSDLMLQLIWLITLGIISYSLSIYMLFPKNKRNRMLNLFYQRLRRKNG